MEDTLRDLSFYLHYHFHQVLILVLMEDTLREELRQGSHRSLRCLNPCFNGRYSQRAAIARFGIIIKS